VIIEKFFSSISFQLTTYPSYYNRQAYLLSCIKVLVNETSKELFEMIEVVYVHNQAFLTHYVEGYLIYFGDPTRKHYIHVIGNMLSSEQRMRKRISGLALLTSTGGHDLVGEHL
jgi:hypothetical protein